MASVRLLAIFLSMTSMLLLTSSSSSHAPREFPVGGNDGWVLKPSEDYNHWAQRNRFQVNDTLRFRYKKGSDSVLVVKKEDYDSCNTNNPIQKMDDGDSVFKLSDPGLYYFISGNVDNCKHGEKLIVLVLAVKHTLHPPATEPVPPAKSPAASGLQHPLVPSSHLVPTPAPSPSKASSSASLGGVGVWVVLMFAGFAAVVY